MVGWTTRRYRRVGDRRVAAMSGTGLREREMGGEKEREGEK